jgi:hypothetical protein
MYNLWFLEEILCNSFVEQLEECSLGKVLTWGVVVACVARLTHMRILNFAA